MKSLGISIDNKEDTLNILSYAYLLFVVISLTLVAKLILIKIPFTSSHITITGATLVMPVAFFIQNIITESYGYVKSRRLVQVSVPFIILYIFILKFISDIPSPEPTTIYSISDSYSTVFNSLPKHLYGLLIAIFACSLTNDYLISRSKVLFSGRFLGIRFIIAVILGEAFPHIVSIFVWWGVLNLYSEILPLILFSYFYKIVFEVAATPLNYAISNFLKHKRGADVYDNNVKYNPFLWQ